MPRKIKVAYINDVMHYLNHSKIYMTDALPEPLQPLQSIFENSEFFHLSLYFNDESYVITIEE